VILAQAPQPHAPQTAAVLVPSSPPTTFNIEPRTEGRKGGGTWLVRIAMAAGVVLALLRNDLLHDLAQNTGLADRYAVAEARVLGGPTFGTVRAVERLVADCGGHLEPIRLPLAVTEFADSQKRQTARSALPSVSETEKSAAVSPERSGPSQAKTNVQTPASSAKTEEQSRQNMGKALGGQALKSAPARNRPIANEIPTKKRAAAGTKSGVRANGSYYDPLNGAL